MVRFADIFKKKMAEESAAATQAEPKKSPFAHINSPAGTGQATLPPAVPNPKLVKVSVSDPAIPVPRSDEPVRKPDIPSDVRFSQAFSTAKHTFPANSPFAPTAVGGGKPEIQADQRIGAPINDEEQVRLAFADIIKTQEMDSSRKSLEVYEKLALLVQNLFSRIERKISLKGIDLKEVTDVINEAVWLIVNGDRGLLDLTYRSSPENYLISHMVNVCILSLEIGRGVGYNRSKLEELGLCGLLHDVGMQDVFPLVKFQDKLLPTERDRVKMHIMAGMNILKEIDGLPPVVIEVAYQHHERVAGSGYRGLGGESINEYAKIIGLADTFEAITHARPHRPSRSGQAAIKELIETAAEQFDKEALKVLVKRIGIYPVGTWVKLNTGEIARVIKVNETFPLRPVVVVMEPLDRDNVMETRHIDLATNHNIYISTTIEEADLLMKKVMK